MIRASIIIVNYNSGDRLQKCLDHLAAQTADGFEIIVINNASTDGSEASVKNNSAVNLILAEENLGFAAANNRAAKEASGEWLVFLNPDAYAEPGWLAALFSAADNYQQVEAFGSTQIDATNTAVIDGAGDVYHAYGLTYRARSGWTAKDIPGDHECFSPCAAAMMIKASRFRDLGGFDERFFCYGEDVDLGFRLRLAGGRAMQVKDAVVHHEGSGVTGRYSEFTIYHGNRNRIWLTHKNMPLPLYIALAPLHVLINLYLLARYTTIGKGTVYFRALRDGYSGVPMLNADRNRIQKARVASVGAIASKMVWSPMKAMRRDGKFRPLKFNQ